MAKQTTLYLPTGAPVSVSITAASAGVVNFFVAGAPGLGDGTGVAGIPGFGGEVTGTLTAISGDTLTLYVGEPSGYGYHNGGAGGLAYQTTVNGTVYGKNGGSGGGSSALLQNGNLVCEAGGGAGGGGSGGYGNPNGGGIGGFGGGAPVGGAAGYNTSYGGNAGGGGQATGAGGTAGPMGGAAGAAGAAGVGGAGGAGGTDSAGGGGGGGGGTTGGGGGGGAGANSAGGGGGGGKSTVTAYADTSFYSDSASTLTGLISLTTTVAPTVTVTGPSGTVSATSQPAVTWAYSSTVNSPQTFASVSVFAEPAGGWPAGLDGTGSFTGGALAPVATTTVLGVATSWAIPVGLPNGTYRAYVRVSDTGPGQETSAWEYSEWGQGVAGPAAAGGITATPYPKVARVLLTIPNSSPPPTYNIRRSTDGGNTWQSVLGGTGFPTTATTTYFWDRGAERETQLLYQVQGVSGAVVGAWSASVSAYLISDGHEWIVSAGESTLDNWVVLQGPDLAGMAHEDQAVYSPEGRFDNVVVGGTIHAEQFVAGIGSALLTFAFANDFVWQAFLTMRSRREPVLYRSIYGDGTLEQFWIRLGPDAGTLRKGGGDRGLPGANQRGGQIRTVQIAAYVVAEPSTTLDTTPPGAPTPGNTIYSKPAGQAAPNGLSQWTES